MEFTNEDLEVLSESGGPEEVRLVALIRRLASENLALVMQEIARGFTGEPWPDDLEYHLWRAITEGAERLTEEQIAKLVELSELSNGWWYFSPDFNEFIFLDLSKWKNVYADHRRKASGADGLS